jgi:hypothetical protein
METGRNWQGWAALLLAGLALFVALSGHLDFRFSLSNGSANAVTEAQAVQIGPDAGLAQQKQALQDELNKLRGQLGQTGPAVPIPAPPGAGAVPAVPQAPQAPSLAVPIPDAPRLNMPIPDGPKGPRWAQGWAGQHSGGGFGPFGLFGGGFLGPFQGAMRLIPWLGLGLLIWFLARRGRAQGGQAARRATTPLAAPPPPEGPSGAQS